MGSILVVFSLSYILGCIYNILLTIDDSKVDENGFWPVSTRLLLDIPFSIIPLCSIILFHRSNLKATKMHVR